MPAEYRSWHDGLSFPLSNLDVVCAASSSPETAGVNKCEQLFVFRCYFANEVGIEKWWMDGIYLLMKQFNLAK